MAVNRGAPAWRAWLRNILLPYADLGIDGGPGNVLSTPDDIQLALTYGVLQTPYGSRVEQGLNTGAQIVSLPTVPTANQYCSGAISINAAATQPFTFGFTALYVLCGTATGSSCKVLYTIPGLVNTQLLFFSSTSPVLTQFPCTGVNITNNAGSAALFSVLAFGN